MTHSLYLSIIGAVVLIAAYIILRLLRDNERLIAELDKAKAEANDIIQSQRKQLVLKAKESQKNKYSITQLNSQLNVMSESVAEYNNEAKAWKIKFNAVDAEHRKTIKHLYGRIGAMQRKINRLKK